MVCPTKIVTNLNQAEPSIMHLDINSCFATLEQQSNPLLRGVPLVVAAYDKPFGCVLAASYEAKLYGVKTGMVVDDAKKRCPFLVVREADPDKYRFVHRGLRAILDTYSPNVYPRSIDEFVIELEHTPFAGSYLTLTRKLKERIRRELGDWITVSVGVGPSRFLAKLGADIDKPNGYQLIASHNLLDIYSRIELTDFCGINTRLERRLKEQGIFTPLDFLTASQVTLKAAFRSVSSRDWYLRVRGYEVDNFEFERRSYGQSYVLPRVFSHDEYLPILAKLVDKATLRMRGDGYMARGVHISLGGQGGPGFAKSRVLSRHYFMTQELSLEAVRLASLAPRTLEVKSLAVSFFDLAPLKRLQLALDEDLLKKRELTAAVDSITRRYGPYTIHSASMLGTQAHVRDAIAFGK